MALIEIIVVSWNVADLLAACLRSILSQEGASAPRGDTVPLGQYDVRVHVVDNASSDGTVAMLREQFPWVHTVASTVNLGFTGGNNLGVRGTSGDYILLLNPDTELAPDSLSVMLRALAQHPEVGIVGPRLTYGDGAAQPSRRRFPTFAMALFESTLLEQWFPSNRWARRYRMEDVPDSTEQRVDWLTGACLMTRRAVWNDIGPLDDAFFMYSEELDWCQRAAAAGWQCLYVPTAHVVHYEGRSSGQVIARRHMLFNAAKVLYWRKHHGRLAAEALRAYLLLTFAFQLVEETIKWLLGHKRTLRAERIAAYSWLIRTRLARTHGMSEEKA